MLITRQLVRTLALALPLAVAAYPQALVHYGAAVTAGTAVGTAAGKRASDALTSIMNNAASTAQAAGNSADVAAAEAKMMKDTNPSEYKSTVKAANMPGAPDASPSPAPTSAPAPSARSSKVKAEAPLVATLARSVSPATGKAAATSRPGAIATTAVIAGPPVPEAAELPITMQQVLNNFHPVLEPLAERVQRVAPGNSRADLKRMLGSPASRVSIPAERDMTEIYYYQEKGRNVATVRLEAGEVTSISIN